MPNPPFITAVALAAFFAGCAPPWAMLHDGMTADTVAFVNVNVVPMTSEVILTSHTVVIRGDRIVEIGPSAGVNVPPEARKIDGTGKYLLPGLVDLHVHLRAESELAAYLRHGVTTVAAMRGTDTVLALREQVRSGALAGPRVLTAGPLVDGEPPVWPGAGTRVVTTVAEARAVAEAHCREGYDFLKVYNNLQPRLLAEVVSHAHRCGIPVAAHLPRTPVRVEGLRRGLEAGIDVIAHGEEVFFTHFGGASDAAIQRQREGVDVKTLEEAALMIRDAGAYVIPNLSFIAMTARMLENLDDVLGDPEFTTLTPDGQQMWREQNPTRRRDLDAFTRREQLKRTAVTTLTRHLLNAGVPLLLGTDASAPGMFPGRSAHVELEELVAAGLTPFEALATGTANAGRFAETRLKAFRGRHLGTIQRDGVADLLLLRGNPLADVRNVSDLEGVMAQGRWRPASREQATSVFDAQVRKAERALRRATLAGAPLSSPCTAPEARAFDFWIGDWDIRQQILRKDGTWLELPAHTSVTATLDGCALIEHWQGQVSFFWEGMQEPETMRGLSVRAYDHGTGKWFIHWMDTRAPRFGAPYAGTFVSGRGEFFREFETPEGRRVGRITFSDIAADSVAWELAISTDDRKTWQTLWTMDMRRSRPGAGRIDPDSDGGWGAATVQRR
jgi:imidazolonepropionase-like amidohydrolase